MNNLVRYEPFYELQSLRRSVDHLMDEMLARVNGGYFDDPWYGWPSWFANRNMVVGDNLAIDVLETSDDIIVRCSLPGVHADEIEIDERDGYLSIRAQRMQEEKREQNGWYQRELRYGALRRTVRLPAAVNSDKAEAELHNGVLTITLPKADGGKPLFQRIKLKLPQLKLPVLGKKEPKIRVVHS